MEAIFRGTAAHTGKIIYINPKDFEDYCIQYRGMEVDVHIKPVVRNSTKLRLYSYYQAVILPFCIQALTEAGYDGADEDLADTYLKSECAKGIKINRITDEQMTFLMEKKRMTKERLSKFVTDCILLLRNRHSVEVPDSASYLESKRTGNLRNFKKIR